MWNRQKTCYKFHSIRVICVAITTYQGESPSTSSRQSLSSPLAFACDVDVDTQRIRSNFFHSSDVVMLRKREGKPDILSCIWKPKGKVSTFPQEQNWALLYKKQQTKIRISRSDKPGMSCDHCSTSTWDMSYVTVNEDGAYRREFAIISAQRCMYITLSIISVMRRKKEKTNYEGYLDVRLYIWGPNESSFCAHVLSGIIMNLEMNCVQTFDVSAADISLQKVANSGCGVNARSTKEMPWY